MSTMKLLGLAFVATLALSAIGAFGAGSASALLFLTSLSKELFTLLNLNTALNPVRFELKSGRKVECESVLGDGLILNKTDEIDHLLLTFHKCQAEIVAGVKVECSSAGEPHGLIATLGLDALLVTLLLTPNDKYGLLLGEEHEHLATFTCGTTTVEAEGDVVGEFKETLTESQALKASPKLEFKKGSHAGEPGIKSYWTLKSVFEPQLLTTLRGPFNETQETSLDLLVDLLPLQLIKFCHN